PAGGTRATPGVQDITYWCGNRNVGLQEPFVLERECYRSVDAGQTWELRSILFTNPLPQHSRCGLHAEDISSGDANYPQGAPDGSLYLIVSCNHVAYLARSTDEAATFPIVATLPIPAGSDSAGWPELRVDGTGALVLVTEPAGKPELELRRSTDAGRTWQEARMPGRANSTVWTFAVGPADPRLVYAASVSGEVYRSTDRGISWDKLRREFGEIRALAWTP
ncbi:MAG TPA: hypothetical protein VGY66_33605, partial [Gemmataceae bacterium]|nr:hypothetical protein [Gemmataceae bacterium]